MPSSALGWDFRHPKEGCRAKPSRGERVTAGILAQGDNTQISCMGKPGGTCGHKCNFILYHLQGTPCHRINSSPP